MCQAIKLLCLVLQYLLKSVLTYINKSPGEFFQCNTSDKRVQKECALNPLLRCKSLMIPYMSSLYITETAIIVLMFQWKHALKRSHCTLHCILNQIFSQCIVSKILKLPKLQFIANYNVWQSENTLLFKSLSSAELHLQNIFRKQRKFINAVLEMRQSGCREH